MRFAETGEDPAFLRVHPFRFRGSLLLQLLHRTEGGHSIPRDSDGTGFPGPLFRPDPTAMDDGFQRLFDSLSIVHPSPAFPWLQDGLSL